MKITKVFKVSKCVEGVVLPKKGVNWFYLTKLNSCIRHICKSHEICTSTSLETLHACHRQSSIEEGR